MINNADWLCKLNLIDFLRDVGKHFTVNVMLEKDSVRSRMDDRAQGISYTEFSYMLLQAYDFYHLFREAGCRLQIGGSDQFGNITAGCELIRRKRPESESAETWSAYGLTTTLITDASGAKIGKTTKGALWLDPKKTSPYDFYQYWINVTDADAKAFVRYFTELPESEVLALDASHAADPSKRIIQKKLAQWMTEKVHGVTERENAEKAASALFPSSGGTASLADLDEATLLSLVKDAPSSQALAKDAAGRGGRCSDRRRAD